MSKNLIGTICIVVVVIIGFLFYASVSNRHADILNQASAQQKANEVIYDEVWKIL